MTELKKCSVDPTHVWMANVAFCPYCNISPEARVYYAQRQRDDEREMKRRGVKQDRRRP